MSILKKEYENLKKDYEKNIDALEKVLKAFVELKISYYSKLSHLKVKLKHRAKHLSVPDKIRLRNNIKIYEKMVRLVELELEKVRETILIEKFNHKTQFLSLKFEECITTKNLKVKEKIKEFFYNRKKQSTESIQQNIEKELLIRQSFNKSRIRKNEKDSFVRSIRLSTHNHKKIISLIDEILKKIQII